MSPTPIGVMLLVGLVYGAAHLLLRSPVIPLVHGAARLLAAHGRYRPVPARPGGRRAAAAAERRLAHRLLTSRIDAATYRRRMGALAHSTRRPRGVRHG